MRLFFFCLASSLFAASIASQNVADAAFKIRQYDEEMSMRLVNAIDEYDGLLLAGSQDAVDLVATSVRRPLGSWHYKYLTGAALNTFKGPDAVYLCPLPGAGSIVVADGKGWGRIEVKTGTAFKTGVFKSEDKCRGLFPVGKDSFLLVTQKSVRLYSVWAKQPAATLGDTLKVICATLHGDTLVCVDERGIFFYSISQKTKLPSQTKPPPAPFWKNNSRKCAAFWGETLVLGNEHRLWKMTPDGRFASPPDSLPQRCDILALAEYGYAGASCLFVATDVGLYYWQGNQLRPFPIPVDRLRQRPTQFTALHVTRDNALLIGTRSAGVLVFRDDRPTLIVPHIPFPDSADYENNYARCMTFLDNAETIAIGTDNGKVVLYDLKNRKTLAVRDIEHKTLHDTRAIALAYDRANGALYAGLNTGVVLRYGYDARERRLGREDTLAFERPVDSFGVSTLLLDRQGALWVAGVSGLFHAGPSHAPLMETPKSRKYRIRFLAARGAEIWCATETGIFRVSGRPGDTLRQLQGFDTLSISHLYFIDTARLLISTRTDGAWLAALEGNQLKILRHFDARNGLSVYREPAIYLVYACLPDDKGQVWMSTNRGLFRIALDDPGDVFTWYNYKDLGLPWPAEFNTGSFAQSAGRVLLFGSRDGMAEIRGLPGRRYAPPGKRHFTIWKDGHDNVPGFNIKGLIPAGGRESLLQGFSVARYYFIPTGFADDGSPAVLVHTGQWDTVVITGGASYELFENSFQRSFFDFTESWRLVYNDGQAALPGEVIFVENKEQTVLILLGLALLALISWYFIRRERQSKRKALRQEQEKNRLKETAFQQETRQANLLALLHETGSKLTGATRIADIQAIFNEPGFEHLLRETLNSDQIAVALYHAGTGTLQIDAYYAGEEHRNHPGPVVYWLEESLRHASGDERAALAEQVALDQNRPMIALWGWANGKREPNMPDDPDELVNNNAEFYARHGRRRQEPKIGFLSDSFIFQTIRVEDKPVGIITVQQRHPGAYTRNEKTGRYREADYLEVLRHYLALAISRIHKMQEQRLSELQAELQRHALQHRFSSHFIGNSLAEASRLANFERGPTDYLDRLAAFYKQLFLQIAVSTELRHELDLVQSYFSDIHNQFNRNIRKPAILLEQRPESIPNELARLRIPSFILLNTIHNSVEHNEWTDDLQKIAVHISLEARENAGATVLTITVRDNAPGNYLKKSAPGREGFTKQLRRYFEELNDTYGLTKPESRFALDARRLEAGEGFQTTIQINCQHL